MKRYDGVFSYLELLSSGRDKVGRMIYEPNNMPYVQYSCDFVTFIGEIYKTDLPDPHYMEQIETCLPPNSNLADYIENADLDLLRAILTFYLRQERFCEGFWLKAAKNGDFHRIIKALQAKCGAVGT